MVTLANASTKIPRKKKGLTLHDRGERRDEGMEQTEQMGQALVVVVILFGITQIFAYQQDLKVDAMEAELHGDSAEN